MKSSARIIPKVVRRLSKQEKRPLLGRSVKLMEEAGELAAEILRVEGMKSCKGKSKELVMYDLHLEAIDVMLMTWDILVHTGASEHRIKTIMNKQIEKWQDKTR